MKEIDLTDLNNLELAEILNIFEGMDDVLKEMEEENKNENK